MRVLVFGTTGQVSRALAQTTWPQGTTLDCLGREAADMTQPDLLGAILRSRAPDAVVIAAAYTAVDKAESEEGLATTINALAPGAIAREAAALSVPLVYLSTDYVFDGAKEGFYLEGDPVGPLNAYGRSKLAGELAVQAANPQHLILRTSWVYAAEGANFLKSMLRAAERNDEVRVVSDQHGCPTSAADIASAIARALPMVTHESAKFGTYHIAGAAGTTWYGFAEAIFEGLLARGLPRPRNIPIATADYPTAARRPRNSCLSSDWFAQTFGFRLPGFQTALAKVLDEAVGRSGSAIRTPKEGATQ